MEAFLIKALQLILCFSILILLHEGGHFFFAKLFKVRVEKFCLFFDPWKTLLKFKPKKSETEYCLGWLPLGGYVKIAGMIDESMDREQMKQPPQPWEFRTKPAWQRLLIMLGGVMVNFVLALFIYSMVLFVWGETYVPMQSMTQGMAFSEEAKALGFRDGDILLGVDDKTFRSFDNSTLQNIYRDLSNGHTAHIRRAGRSMDITLPAEGMNMLDMFRSVPPFVMPYIPSRIDSVMPGGAAGKAGIRKGDHLVGFNGTALKSWNEYNVLMARLHESLKDAPTDDSLAARHVTLWVERAATGQVDTVPLMLNSALLMGIGQANAYALYPHATRKYGVLEAIPAGIRYGWKVFAGYVNDLKYLFTKDGAKSIGSFGTIGSMFPNVWSWKRFWELTAFISLILAFMNILPIPALDGGHVFFLLCEIVTRRKPSEKFMERAQLTGMWILIALMVYAVGNDIFRFLLKDLF